MAMGPGLEGAQGSLAKPSMALRSLEPHADAQHPSTPASVVVPCLGPRYLSRLSAHKKVTEELAGRAPWVSGHKGKLAVVWAPGGVEYSPQGVCHQEHLGRQRA